MRLLLRAQIWPIWRAYSVFGPCDVSQRIRLGSLPLRAPAIPATSALSRRTPHEYSGLAGTMRRGRERFQPANASRLPGSAGAFLGGAEELQVVESLVQA